LPIHKERQNQPVSQHLQNSLNVLSDLGQPFAVQSLFLVQREVLNESGELLIEASALQILNKAGLQSLVQSCEIGSLIAVLESIEFVLLLERFNVLSGDDAVDLNLRVSAGELENESLVASVDDGGHLAEVFVVLILLLSLLLILALLLLILLVIGGRSGLEDDGQGGITVLFNDFDGVGLVGLDQS